MDAIFHFNFEAGHVVYGPEYFGHDHDLFTLINDICLH